MSWFFLTFFKTCRFLSLISCFHWISSTPYMIISMPFIFWTFMTCQFFFCNMEAFFFKKKKKEFWGWGAWEEDKHDDISIWKWDSARYWHVNVKLGYERFENVVLDIVVRSVWAELYCTVHYTIQNSLHPLPHYTVIFISSFFSFFYLSFSILY